jgi:uncharacterized protein (DUF305 family)
MAYPYSRIALIAPLILAVGACEARSDAEGAAVDSADTLAAESEFRQAAAADSAFLVRMTDHHQGLIAMATEAEEKATGEVRRDAARLAGQQRKEQQEMLGHLTGTFGATHSPEVMPSNRIMADSLRRLSGAQYDQGFYHNVVLHHQEGIRMIDSAHARLSDAKVRGMADSMKAQQEREISEFESKMGTHADH